MLCTQSQERHTLDGTMFYWYKRGEGSTREHEDQEVGISEGHLEAAPRLPRSSGLGLGYREGVPASSPPNRLRAPCSPSQVALLDHIVPSGKNRIWKGQHEGRNFLSI